MKGDLNLNTTRISRSSLFVGVIDLCALVVIGGVRTYYSSYTVLERAPHFLARCKL